MSGDLPTVEARFAQLIAPKVLEAPFHKGWRLTDLEGELRTEPRGDVPDERFHLTLRHPEHPPVPVSLTLGPRRPCYDLAGWYQVDHGLEVLTEAQRDALSALVKRVAKNCR